MKKRSIIHQSLLIVAATFVVGEGSSSIGASEQQQQQHDQSIIRPNLRRKNTHNNNDKKQHRALTPGSYCGSNWQEAHDNCDPNSCLKDEDCGPGKFCHHYIECTPPSSTSDGPTNGGLPPSDIVGYSEAVPVPTPLPADGLSTPSPNYMPAYIASLPPANGGLPPSDIVGYSEAVPVPTPLPADGLSTPSPNYMPAYIASLPAREPGSTPPPFTLPQPTPNTMSNPTNNYCGYGWESAVAECFHACPSGKDDECPGGRTCHSWLSCKQATVDPAIYNVCGTDWNHAASTCSRRCFLGGDDLCPSGQSCFGGVTACEDNPNLPPLTAEDVGIVEKSYTQEEIAILLDEEIAQERDDEQMSNPANWWCGTSWNNMLETCEKRCTTDEECKPNSWTDGFCFKTTGGPENCSTPGVPVKDPSPPGSMWCGSSWNNMLETCEKQCQSDEDCGVGKTCWSAPDTCQYIGVPVKEVSEVGSLWCGIDYDDAITSCHKPCPNETNDECPSGMSCFSGSSCSVEGEPVVIAAQQTSGSFCGSSWGETIDNCGQPCKMDDECPNQQWCFWVDCNMDSPANANMGMMSNTTTTDTLEQPTIGEGEASCNAEVKQCPNGQFVPRAPQLNCDFYPCPDGGDEGGVSVGSGEGGESTGTIVQQESSSYAAAASSTSTNSGTDLSGWGSTPLSHSCTSDGAGNCGLCQGDCNSDDDCQVGLECFSRGQGEMTSVPGCISGGEDDKPGMDYCYTPFQPEIPTTTTTTTTPTMSVDDSANFMSANMQDYTPGNLGYARECTASEPCGLCEGNCDNSSHCADGLECFSRGVGSVDLVPGCLGLGIAGMDYCYDPGAPIVTDGEQPPQTTNPPTDPVQQEEVLAGCSAEVRFCPGGKVIYQDPKNNCEWPACSNPGINSSESQTDITADATEPPATLSFDGSSYFCGYSLIQVNGNCESSKPCPSGQDTECDGMHICIPDTSCGPPAGADANVMETTTTTSSIPPASDDANVMETTSTTSSIPPAGDDACDDLCLDIIPSEFCPSDLNLPNCLEVGVGEVCEADGECATDDQLNNCGTYDIYARVVCGYDTPSQGQIMRGTLSPTSRPSASPTPLPTATPVSAEPTMSPILPTTYTPTIDAEQMAAMMASASATSTNNDIISSVADDASTTHSISIADAIANATANAAELSSSQEGPSSPPITDYESNAFTFDRNPGDGEHEDTTPDVGSSEWYSVVYGDDPSTATAEDDNDHGYSAEGWNFDTYFEASRNSATQRISRISMIIGIVAVLLTCRR